MRLYARPRASFTRCASWCSIKWGCYGSRWLMRRGSIWRQLDEVKRLQRHQPAGPNIADPERIDAVSRWAGRESDRALDRRLEGQPGLGCDRGELASPITASTPPEATRTCERSLAISQVSPPSINQSARGQMLKSCRSFCREAGRTAHGDGGGTGSRRRERDFWCHRRFGRRTAV